MNRRTFLKGLVGAAAGLAVSGRMLPQAEAVALNAEQPAASAFSPLEGVNCRCVLVGDLDNHLFAMREQMARSIARATDEQIMAGHL